ncbi:MAG: hypothetical protein IAI50_19165 [Candidatus Eremiobacteraeota bacterium]|nr:hypothetical protein [Candidatus Eremiobacteraeota bacterium]
MATDREFEQCRKVFGAATRIRNSYFAEALAEERVYDVVLLQMSGRSNAPAQAAARRMMEDFRPEYIFLIGTSGGILEDNGNGRDGSKLGDVVVADYIQYVELMKVSNGNLLPRHAAIDHPSHDLQAGFVHGLRHEGTWPQYIGVEPPGKADPTAHSGTIAVGEKIYGDADSEFQKMVFKEAGKALAVEMESYGVARAIYEFRRVDYSPQYLTIRGISDFANAPDADEVRDSWTSYAASAAASFAKSVVGAILAEPDEDT